MEANETEKHENFIRNFIWMFVEFGQNKNQISKGT